jgi:hypothetical protein
MLPVITAATKKPMPGIGEDCGKEGEAKFNELFFALDALQKADCMLSVAGGRLIIARFCLVSWTQWVIDLLSHNCVDSIH